MTEDLSQVTIRMAPNGLVAGVEETLGLGYIYRVRGQDSHAHMVAECGPRQRRDFTHRHCVTKERHSAVVQQLQDALASARRTPRSQLEVSVCSPSVVSMPSQASPIAPFDLSSRLRGTPDVDTDVRALQSKLRRTEWNTRKLRQSESEAAEAISKLEVLKDQLKRLKEELRCARSERDSALHKVRDAERSECLAAAASQRASTLLGVSRSRETSLTSNHEREVQELKCELDGYKELVQQKDVLLQRHAEAEAEKDKTISCLKEQCKKATDKLWQARTERDAALEARRQEEQRALNAEREMSVLGKRASVVEARVQSSEKRRKGDVARMERAAAVALKVMKNEVLQIEKMLYGGQGVGEGLMHKVRKADSLLAELGLSHRRLPNAQCIGEERRFWENVKFLTKALETREPHAVALALRRSGMMESVLKCGPAQSFIKAAILDALAVLQKHWSARHALMVQFEVHCSRAEYDTLRHLLSFSYNHDTDMYERLVIWENPTNAADTILAPTVAARTSYEKERAELFRKCGAASSDDGLFCGVERIEDSVLNMVEHYWEALDPAVARGDKELLLVFTGDATGGWRGEAITHGEIAIGSWAKGKGVSKLSALPLFIMEGDDSADNLRCRAQPVATFYNDLKRKGTLVVHVDGKAIQMKVKLLCAADFQFFKALMNMSKYTSAIWCMCLRDNLFRRPDERAATWEDVQRFYDSIGCELKDFDTICELNHYSVDVLRGEKFKPFGCRCGWKSGCEQTWRDAIEAHSQLREDERRDAEKVHSSMEVHRRHKPFSPPLLHQGTIDNSADVLHLVFINIFTTFFELTMLIHVFEMQPANREPFEAYLRGIGVPIKVVKAQSVTEMKQSLTGRDAKTILSRASEHLPALLEFAHAAPQEVEAAVEAVRNEQADDPSTGSNAAVGAKRKSVEDDEEYDWEDDDEGDEEEAGGGADDEENEDQLTRVQRDARSWDAFLLLVHAMRPFERDDSQYREARAVETFNAAADVSKEYRRLHPNAMSACPHVALCVLPRQQEGYPHATPRRHPSHFCVALLAPHSLPLLVDGARRSRAARSRSL